MIKVDRADDCIWIVDVRGEPHIPHTEIHLVPSQAEALAEKLIEAAKAGKEYHAEI